MNFLTDTLSDFITVDKVRYPILTDFRIWLEFEKTMKLKDISAKDRLMMAFCLCFDKERCFILPQNAQTAMNELCSFYLNGKFDEKSIKGNGEKKLRAFDFSEDSRYIYSAFLTQYGIDLLSIPYMHWHVFCALLEGLEEERKIKKIIKFRLISPESTENKEKRKYLKKMKELYALSDTRSEEEKEEDVAEVLSRIF